MSNDPEKIRDRDEDGEQWIKKEREKKQRERQKKIN